MTNATIPKIGSRDMSPEELKARAEAKPTPGPWTVRYQDDIWSGTERIAHVCLVGQPVYWPAEEGGEYGGDFFPEHDANLRLIAAAPQMLEALRDLLGVISTDDLIPESVSYMRQARAAIAAATGEQP